MRVHFIPALGDMRIGDITTRRIQQLVEEVVNADNGKPLAVTTVHGIHGSLTMVLGQAVADKLLSANPATHVRLPEDLARRAVALERDEVQALLAVCQPEGRRLLTVAVGTGLRQGELLAIGSDPRDVDFAHGKLHVSR